ncbi:SDR family oxidoreductase [Candidatus Pacearchaeota archaeon]|nr:SDR family oxidoreductase [Candidatus Pacearchaeota archaeon]
MRVLLTGGSKGIGEAILKELISGGHECIVVNRSDILDNEHRLLEVWKYDLSDIEEIKEICERVKQVDIEVLINNAGGGLPCKLEDITIDTIQSEINLNLIAPLMLIQGALPSMKKAGFGRIINISSITAKRGTPFLFSYSAAKAGLNSITQSIAKSLNNTGITVNSVCPGGVETDMSIKGRQIISSLLKQDQDSYQRDMVQSMGLGRLVYPKEIASLVTYLMSKESGFITGQCINACGALEMI